MARRRTLDRLTSIQPTSGGFLEAVPLTSFVTMSMASAEMADHPVTVKGVEFLKKLVRPDGSWPIDSNLATWVTTLSVDALGDEPDLSSNDRSIIRDWLLDQQYRHRHPYTDAEPGGWAWTDLPGGVPDADDTAGAIVALHHLGPTDRRTREAAINGIRWLIRLQNRDGGIPTFCRGWGRLPFDRSCPDITAHAIRAMITWLATYPEGLAPGKGRNGFDAVGFLNRATGFLQSSQRGDGAWAPLWFGNEAAPDEANLTYGTSRALMGLNHPLGVTHEMKRRGIHHLLASQHEDGSWGGAGDTPSSIEETAWAVEALTNMPDARRQEEIWQAVKLATSWLIEKTAGDLEATPIGFYFAKLWYYEKLYPLIFATAALKRVQQRLETEP
jgi:squalene-hopene/tetraprenyl-beta-curcumene cyclase